MSISNEWKVILAGLAEDRTSEPENISVDWYKVIDVSAEHSVQCFIYDFYKTHLKAVDERVHSELKSAYMELIFKQKIMNQEGKRMLAILMEEGISFAALKGITMLDVYERPLSRIMGDIDILTTEDTLPRIDDIFTREGYKNAGRSNKDVVYINKDDVKFECHYKLFVDRGSMDRNWFYDQCLERLRWHDGLGCNVLDHNDSFTYICSHAAKHLIYSGCGIRPLMDIKKYYERYHEEICMEEVEKNLHKLGYHKIVIYLLEACNRYLNSGFNHGFHIQQELFDAMIYKIQVSGAFGQVREARFQKIYRDKDLTHEQSSFKSKMKVVFPGYDKMKDLYPMIEKRSYLLPVLWIYRILCNLPKQLGLASSFLVSDFKSEVFEDTYRMIEELKKNNLVVGGTENGLSKEWED